MLLNKLSKITISSRQLKLLKFQSKIKIVKQLFIEKVFIAIFFCDFISQTFLSNLKFKINGTNLQQMFLNKNILKTIFLESNILISKNFIKNNILIFYNKKNEPLKIADFFLLKSLKHLHFLGIFLEKKFLRPSEHLLNHKLHLQNLNKLTCKILYQKQSLLKNNLLLKKNYY